MKKRIAICLALILMMGMTLQASAASEGTLSDCILSISCASNGVRVSFNENSTAYADEIGCTDIVLEEKTGLFSWKTININGSSTAKSMTHGSYAVYTGATKGKTYRASCTHYAKFGNKTVTVKGSTGEMVYN